MLIVADGADVRDLLPENDPSIRLFHIEHGFEIGTKRNFGCEQAQGDIIIHFDDDDYSAPARVADQVARLVASGYQVNGYKGMRFTDGHSWARFKGRPGYVLGTSLCYWREYWRAHPFAAVQIGEDNGFVARANQAGVLDASADAGDLMYATTHAANTSPRSMEGPDWEPISIHAGPSAHCR